MQLLCVTSDYCFCHFDHLYHGIASISTCDVSNVFQQNFKSVKSIFFLTNFQFVHLFWIRLKGWWIFALRYLSIECTRWKIHFACAYIMFCCISVTRFASRNFNILHTTRQPCQIMYARKKLFFLYVRSVMTRLSLLFYSTSTLSSGNGGGDCGDKGGCRCCCIPKRNFSCCIFLSLVNLSLFFVCWCEC